MREEILVLTKNKSARTDERRTDCSIHIIASKGARYLRFLARRASDRKRGRDGTAYSDYHASGGFLAHHLARISMAAVYWDAQHIDEGVRFLKQHAQPHA